MGETNLENPLVVGGLPRVASVDVLKPSGTHGPRLVVSAFGDKDPGDLRLYTLDGKEETILLPVRGCVEAQAVDIDDDGDEDILALFAQGHQQMWALLNDGQGGFSSQKLLWQKRPGQGYTGFEVADFNQDGILDLVTFSGNNLGIPDPPIRRHHGLGIYQGDGKGGFSEEAFIPLPGAIGIDIGDVDLDGRLDIVAVANFVDWRVDQPAGVILCRNVGSFRFDVERLPVASTAPYLSVKMVDIDADTDLDILLGGFP